MCKLLLLSRIYLGFVCAYYHDRDGHKINNYRVVCQPDIQPRLTATSLR